MSRKGWFHLESKSLWLVAGAASLLGALVILPRPTQSRVLPLPSFDWQEAVRQEKDDLKRTARVRSLGLDHDLRVVGELFRRLGAALFQSAGRELSPAEAALSLGYRVPDSSLELARLRQASRRLVDRGRAALLLDLRALQTELFVAAVRSYESQSELSADLMELGGDFLAEGDGSWVGGPDRQPLHDAELRLLFRARFRLLTATQDVPELTPSLDEQRRYYAVLLEHPPLARGAPPAFVKLEIARALGKADAEYPLALAEGLLLLELGMPDAARAVLHAGRRSQGPWATLTRNAWLSADRHARWID